ncbi:MAG: hypothetical protein J7K61_02050 [Thermoplasmata archaeon]|nr:hypothetical protein [Thermoplasmata archaeon]
MENEITIQAKKETQEYIHYIGERIHRLQILADKCYNAVKTFNEEMERFSDEFPELEVIEHSLRLKIDYTTPDDPDIKKY